MDHNEHKETRALSSSRRAYDLILRGLLYFCAAVTCLLLVFVIGYIFVLTTRGKQKGKGKQKTGKLFHKRSNFRFVVCVKIIIFLQHATLHFTNTA